MKGIKTNRVTFSEERKYLVNFLEIVYQKQNKTDIILANKITELVETLTRKAPEWFKPDPSPVKDNQYCFTLPDSKVYDNTIYFYLSKNSQIIIEDYVYRKFRTVFDMHMEKMDNMQFKVAIKNFMEIYQISEDKYEMLKKQNYRDRIASIPKKTEKINRIFNSSLSPVSPVLSCLVLLCPLLSFIL